MEVMKRLEFNKETGFYTITETGFKYEFPESLFDDFKHYIFRYNLVSRWYKNLEDSDLNKVHRTSAYENI